MTRHVIGVFEEIDPVQSAVEALLNEGASEDQVSVLRWENSGHGEELLEYDQEERAEAINAGLWSGGALGAVAGLLAGAAGLIAAPFGVVAVLGALSSALGGAAMGATVGGFVGSLMDIGLDRHDAERLVERLEAGATLLAVTVPTSEAPAMKERLRSLGASEAIVA